MSTVCAYYQTSQGIARQRGPRFEMLQTGETLAELLAHGGVAVLDTVAGGSMVSPDDLVPQNFMPTARVYLVGLNYEDHAAEVGRPHPEELVWGEVDPASLAGAGATVIPPNGSAAQIDYEGEVVVLIGTSLRDVGPIDALAGIAGITGGIDFTARDLQMRALAGGEGAPTMSDAKSFGSSKVIGAGLLIVPPEEFRSLDLGFSLSVNAIQRQRSTTKEMIFSIAEIVSTISKSRTLSPGDAIFTGTPGGVGFLTNQFLRAGDIVEMTLGDSLPLRATIGQ